MRLKSYNGSIRNVSEVTASVERRGVFNGIKRRSFETCRNGSVKPNALVFTFSSTRPEGVGFGVGGVSTLTVGNLSSEKVAEILDSLLTKGYADISNMEFQKLKLDVNAYKFDGGKSAAPYYSECFNSFNSMPSAFNESIFSPIVGENDDFDDMDAESLRRRIYNDSDYTMAELSAMKRDELEKVYDEMYEDFGL